MWLCCFTEANWLLKVSLIRSSSVKDSLKEIALWLFFLTHWLPLSFFHINNWVRKYNSGEVGQNTGVAQTVWKAIHSGLISQDCVYSTDSHKRTQNNAMWLFYLQIRKPDTTHRLCSSWGGMGEVLCSLHLKGNQFPKTVHEPKHSRPWKFTSLRILQCSSQAKPCVQKCIFSGGK